MDNFDDFFGKMQNLLISIHSYLIVFLFFISIYQILFEVERIIFYIDIAASFLFVLLSILIHKMFAKYYQYIKSKNNIAINNFYSNKKYLNSYGSIIFVYVLFISSFIFGLFMLSMGITHHSSSSAVLGLYLMFYSTFFCVKSILFLSGKHRHKE